MPIDKMKILTEKEKAERALAYTLTCLVNGLAPNPPEPNGAPAGLSAPSDEEAQETEKARKGAVDGYYRPALLAAGKYLRQRAQQLIDFAALCETEAGAQPQPPTGGTTP